MKKTILSFALVAVLFSFAGNAKATPLTFNLDVIGSDFSFAAELQATSNGDGSYTAISGSGQFGSSGLFANQVITLTPNPNAPSYISVANGSWLFDNQLLPDSVLLTAYGVNFSFTDSGNDYYVAPWLNSTGPNTYLTAIILQDGSSPSISSDLVTGENSFVTLTAAVPEPSTYALFGIGAIGMLMALRRKKTA